MKVVAPTGDWRTEKAGRHIPDESVGVCEQRLVERLHGVGIGVVHGRVAVGVRHHEPRESRARRDQLRKVVAGAEPVARVQLLFDRGPDHDTRRLGPAMSPIAVPDESVKYPKQATPASSSGRPGACRRASICERVAHVVDVDVRHRGRRWRVRLEHAADAGAGSKATNWGIVGNAPHPKRSAKKRAEAAPSGVHLETADRPGGGLGWRRTEPRCVAAARRERISQPVERPVWILEACERADARYVQLAFSTVPPAPRPASASRRRRRHRYTESPPGTLRGRWRAARPRDLPASRHWPAPPTWVTLTSRTPGVERARRREVVRGHDDEPHRVLPLPGGTFGISKPMGRLRHQSPAQSCRAARQCLRAQAVHQHRPRGSSCSTPRGRRP